MSLSRRLGRLEAARPDPARDLYNLVSRAFSGDRLASWHFGVRLRKALDLDNRQPGEPIDFTKILTNDPELNQAINAQPQELKDSMVARAEAQYGERMTVVAKRLGYVEVDGRWVRPTGDTGVQ